MLIRFFISSVTCAILLGGCSYNYNELSKVKEREPTNFQEQIFVEYKREATFEAEQMHDWNSADLYSKKAIKSLETDNIYPEEIDHWKLPKDKVKEIVISYENLIKVYDEAKIIDPFNLAKAILALDCWAEQQEENWQTWDIERCKENFIKSMHSIYEKISVSEENQDKKNNNIVKFQDKSQDKGAILTKINSDDIIEIIYFDFDKFDLSNVSKNKIKLFVEKYGDKINEYLVIGHTDTKGSKNYNLLLSNKRAEIVQDLLIYNGIEKDKIKILGKGEESLAIITSDDTKHPANRRVEIKKTN